MKHHGFSLIELIVFILIIGIIASALLVSFSTILQNAPSSNFQTTAIALAGERMDIILGQKQMQGFSSFSDPCTLSTPPAICVSYSGYTISSSIGTITIGGDSGYKVITVTISGKGNVVLQTLVGS